MACGRRILPRLAQTSCRADLKPLTKLRDVVGENIVGGFALHLGTREYTFDDRIHVLPDDRLWT